MLRVARVPGYVGYGVSADGRVWSQRQTGRRPLAVTWRELSYTNNKGYLMVGLYVAGVQKWVMVHRLMALVFFAFNPPAHCRQYQVNHQNGDKTDNSLSNLEVVTAQQNIQHAWTTGLSKVHMVGSRHTNSKVTEDQVREMRRLYASKTWSQSQLGSHYGLSQTHVGSILRREVWTHV